MARQHDHVELGVVRVLFQARVFEQRAQTTEHGLELELVPLDVANRNVGRGFAGCQADANQLCAHRQQARRLDVEGE